MDRLNYFKRKLLEILDKKEREERAEIKKSFAFQIDAAIEKSRGYAVGTIREWKGRKFKKMPNSKWVRVYDTHDKHTETSIARLKGRVRRAGSVDELLKIVVENVHRFEDADGKILPIVEELKKEVDGKKNILRLQKDNKETFGFNYGKLSKDEYRKIAESSKPAKADKSIDLNNLPQSARDYLDYMMKSWNENKVISPIFNNVRIRFDGDSYKHFFKGKKGERSQEEIEKRAKCLPYIRDILERTGKRCALIQNDKGQLAYSVVGRAVIDSEDTVIKVIVTKKRGRKYFYLSVNNLNEIKKTALPDEKTGSGAFTPSAANALKKTRAKDGLNHKNGTQSADSNVPHNNPSVNEKNDDKKYLDFAKKYFEKINERQRIAREKDGYTDNAPRFTPDQIEARAKGIVQKVDEMMNRKDYELVDWLSNTDNELSRLIFSDKADVKLPRTQKESRKVLEDWLGKDVVEKHKQAIEEKRRKEAEEEARKKEEEFRRNATLPDTDENTQNAFFDYLKTLKPTEAGRAAENFKKKYRYELNGKTKVGSAAQFVADFVNDGAKIEFDVPYTNYKTGKPGVDAMRIQTGERGFYSFKEKFMAKFARWLLANESNTNAADTRKSFVGGKPLRIFVKKSFYDEFFRERGIL